MSIRVAEPRDAASILRIYEPIVRDTPISFELVPPPEAELSARIEATLQSFPWLVCAERDDLEGYAYASSYRTRAAYQWTAEVTAYVREDRRGRGIARRLYEVLLGTLQEQGYVLALAGIALPNPASVAFHEALGFDHLGTYQRVGYKLGAWHDVGWWQRPLSAPSPEPQPPTPFPTLRRSSEWGLP